MATYSPPTLRSNIFNINNNNNSIINNADGKNYLTDTEYNKFLNLLNTNNEHEHDEFNNVDNTADINKPISILQQSALDLKQDLITDNTNLLVGTVSDSQGNIRNTIDILISETIDNVNNLITNNLDLKQDLLNTESDIIINSITDSQGNIRTNINNLNTDIQLQNDNLTTIQTQIDELTINNVKLNNNNLFSNINEFNNLLKLTGLLNVNNIYITPLQLSYLSNLNSNIQNQINELIDYNINNNNNNTINLDSNNIFTGINEFNKLKLNILNVNNIDITSLQLSYLEGLQSNIQQQIYDISDNTNLLSSNNTFTGINTFDENLLLKKKLIFDNTLSSIPIGTDSLLNCVNGLANIGIGFNSLYNCNSSYNTALGNDSLRSLTTGNRNISIGDFSGTGITIGDNNICIGEGSGFNNPSTQYNDTILIGNYVKAKTSKGIVIGKSDNKTFIDGDLNVGGDLTAITQNISDNSTKVATTEYCNDLISNGSKKWRDVIFISPLPTGGNTVTILNFGNYSISLNSSNTNMPFITSNLATETIVHINNVFINAVNGGSFYGQAIKRTLSTQNNGEWNTTNMSSVTIDLSQQYRCTLYDETNDIFYKIFIILLTKTNGNRYLAYAEKV
jgi:hypothetical protein